MTSDGAATDIRPDEEWRLGRRLHLAWRACYPAPARPIPTIAPECCVTSRRPKPKPRKLSLSGVGKRGVRTQFAALAWRITAKGRLKICLVTSRNSGRWILPKGWPMDGRTPGRAAAREAWEEAGVKGRASERCLGVFDYRKRSDKTRRPHLAMVYPLKVGSVSNTWPEMRFRRRRWVTPQKAATLVDAPGLQQILLAVDPARL